MVQPLLLSPLADTVHRHDRDRFATVMFAPRERREGVLALYAFNAEVARIREMVREPMAGMVRLQWWREVVEGKREEEAARSPVAGPLRAVIRDQNLPIALFETMLDARERDLERTPFADLDEVTAYAEATAGSLAELAVMALGCHDTRNRAAARATGTAWALTGLIRAVPLHLSTGWLALPQDLIAAAGSNAEAVLSGRAPKTALIGAVQAMAEAALNHLTRARHARPGRRGLSVLLIATLARAHLKTLRRAGYDPFDGRVAIRRPMPLRLAIHSLFGMW